MICDVNYSDSLPTIDQSEPVLPICLLYVIVRNRFYKYYDQKDFVIYVKKTDSDKWISGMVVEDAKEYLVITDWELIEEWVL